MKTMKIAVSRELVSKVSTHREKVMLDNTDFTDVAAVVITVVESYSGILALLKRTGFQLPVFMFSTEPRGARGCHGDHLGQSTGIAGTGICRLPV